ncbi:MAG TPA: hypothetical protein IAB84_04230 [Candidatus Choladousia intestinigallinarum]|nr:hypothetical protein [Candidatus Choladousia intestinigallinarum]
MRRKKRQGFGHRKPHRKVRIKRTEFERQTALMRRELRRKRWIRRLSLCLLGLLLLCTAASAEVERMRLPQVTMGDAVPGTIHGQGAEEEYEHIVPLSALFSDGQGNPMIFTVFPQHNRFGESYTVLGLPVEILAMDEEHAALSSGMGGSLVLSSDRPLISEIEVMVTNETEAG